MLKSLHQIPGMSEKNVTSRKKLLLQTQVTKSRLTTSLMAQARVTTAAKMRTCDRTRLIRAQKRYVNLFHNVKLFLSNFFLFQTIRSKD